MHLSKQVIAGNLAGNFGRRIHKAMNPLKLLPGFGSSPGHQVLIFQCSKTFSSGYFESLQDSNLGCEL